MASLQPPPTSWRPYHLFHQDPANDPNTAENFALIVLNLCLANPAPVTRLWDRATIRIAADGGANRLRRLSIPSSSQKPLDLIIGDLDSLTAATRAHYEGTGTRIRQDPDQDSTDFTKATAWAREQGALQDKKKDEDRDGPLDIVALGGLGGRVDQGISQLHHLFLFQADPRYADGRVFLVSEGNVSFVLKAGSHVIHLRSPSQEGRGDKERGEGDGILGKYIGILPVKEPSVINTKGLEWDVQDWPTAMGGNVSTSNQAKEGVSTVEVSTSRDVVFTVSLGAWAVGEDS